MLLIVGAGVRATALRTAAVKAGSLARGRALSARAFAPDPTWSTHR